MSRNKSAQCVPKEVVDTKREALVQQGKNVESVGQQLVCLTEGTITASLITHHLTLLSSADHHHESRHDSFALHLLS
jgi:hypothetical protein